MRATSISTSVEIGLRFVGIWPGLPYGTITWSAYMTSLVFALYFQYVYIFGHFDVYNISNLMDALSITLSYSLGFLKLASLWSNRRIFYDILLAMEEDWSNVDIYDKRVSCIMASNANLSRRCSNVLISINATAALSYSMTSLLRSADFQEDLNVSSRELPIKMEFPFEVDASPLFELLAVGQVLHVVSIAALVAMMNCLIITLVLHVSGQIDILRRELLTMCDNGTSQCDSIVASVKLLIIRHQRIITLSDNIEELYSDIALMQFLSNTIVICCIGFTIIGSKSIGDAVYGALWYNMTPAECRILSFVILRSQKRLTITAGNIMDLTLEGFTSVMKASASYMSVLHAMY
ncbi:odorant receptor 82a isoform X2 [Solenopsis invicta]|uniref:odorant receptor 82a isoform X2 n=1 Tax=Solenopsis invicta TaxID=13686 RepID=UPI00193CA73D|nr:odorant receptor 82a isoform X2 [Solenopsis invicta]